MVQLPVWKLDWICETFFFYSEDKTLRLGFKNHTVFENMAKMDFKKEKHLIFKQN